MAGAGIKGKLRQFFSNITRVSLRDLAVPLMCLAIIAIAVACLSSRYIFEISPFAGEREFESPSGVFGGAEGRVYVVDHSGTAVQVIGPDGYLSTLAGEGGKGFSNAYLVAEADDGRIYVVEAVYSEGMRLGAERVLRFEQDGSHCEEVYRIDYPDAQSAPMQYGRIKSLRVRGNSLIFTVAQGGLITVHLYDAGSGFSQQKEYDLSAFGQIYDVTIDPETYYPAWITWDGGVYAVNRYGSVDHLAAGGEGQALYQLSAGGDGYIYYVDVGEGELWRVRAGSEPERVCACGAYSVDCGTEGAVYMAADGAYAEWKDGQVSIRTGVPVAERGRRIAFTCLAVLGGAMTLALIFRAARYLLRRWVEYPAFKPIAISVTVLAVLAAGAAYIYTSRTFAEDDARVMAGISAFAAETAAGIDAARLDEIAAAADCAGEARTALAADIDGRIAQSYADGSYYYCVVCAVRGGEVFALYDSEGAYLAAQPYFDSDRDAYAQIYSTGERMEVRNEKDSAGVWTYVVEPVLDGDGQVAALLEAGVNMGTYRQGQRAFVVELLLSIVFAAIVLVMLAVECIDYFSRRRKLRQIPREQRLPLDTVPVRTLVYIAIAAECAQDAFVSVLAMSLYRPVLGISGSIGGALPLTVEVASVAVFSVLGVRICAKSGTKKVLVAGFALAAAGFVICGALMNYWALVGGKALVGMGIGLVMAGANAAAGFCRDEERRTRAYNDIATGALVSVSAGSGIGSIVLSVADAQAVFFVSAALLALGLYLALTCRTCREEKRAELSEQGVSAQEKKEARRAMLRFVTDRRVLSFLMLALLPIAVALSYRDYFFPILAEGAGMDEANIGRVLLLNGLVVAYAGVPLGEYVIRKLGAFASLIVALAALAGAMLLYGFVPMLGWAVCGVFVIALANAVGTLGTSTYFTGLPAVERYGQSRAYTFFSFFSSAGETLGSPVFGMIMLIGYQAGMLLMGEIILMVMFLFLIASILGIAKAKGGQAAESHGASTDI